jgi:hypothetical protein
MTRESAPCVGDSTQTSLTSTRTRGQFESLAHYTRTQKYDLSKAVAKSSVAERTAIESVAVATMAADMCMAAPRRGRFRRRRAHFE